MIYQLPSGKVINISLDTYLRMSDDDFKYMEERNMGSSCAINSFNIEEEDLEQLDLCEEIEIEIDITLLDSNIFPIDEGMSSDE